MGGAVSIEEVSAMWLAETDAGFVAKPGGALRDDRALVGELLDLLRRCGIPLVVGGAMDSDLLTIGPLSRRQRDEVATWWAARQRDAGPGPQ
jgi:hypothetical protein